MGAYIIRMRHPPLRSRILQFVPVLVNVILVVCLWLRRDPSTRLMLCVIVGLLVLGLIVRSSIRLFAIHMLPGLLIFISLLVRDDITIKLVLYSIPLILLFSLWAFRPFVLSVNPRFRLVVLGDMVTKMSFSMLKVETDVSSETGRYMVFLRSTEQSSKDSASVYDMFECLSWESENEEEAYQVAEKLRSLGIGSEDPKKERLVPANKKACRLLLAGHIVSLVILLVFISFMARKYNYRVEDNELLGALRFMKIIKIIIAFIFFSIMPYAVYLIRIGWRAVKYQHMPPPETIIIMNTKILDGVAAIKRGRILITIGILLLALSLIGGLFLTYMLERILLICEI